MALVPGLRHVVTSRPGADTNSVGSPTIASWDGSGPMTVVAIGNRCWPPDGSVLDVCAMPRKTSNLPSRHGVLRSERTRRKDRGGHEDEDVLVDQESTNRLSGWGIRAQKSPADCASFAHLRCVPKRSCGTAAGDASPALPSRSFETA